MVNSIDHTIIVYDLNTMDFQKPQEFRGHKTSYYVKSAMSPCSQYIISGSTDNNLYIWKYNVNIFSKLLIIIFFLKKKK